jgi:hypothetical protein
MTKDEIYGQLKAAHDGVTKKEREADELREFRANLATRLRTEHKIKQVKLDGVIHDIVTRNAAERATARANGEPVPDAVYDVATPRAKGAILGE